MYAVLHYRQDCEAALYPIEFINSCSISGMPEHCFILKKGAPYIIMHNISSALCNGTRVIYHRRVGKCLEVEICDSARKGEVHYVKYHFKTDSGIKNFTAA